MAKIAVEQTFGSLNTYALPGGSYDSTKLGLGPLMIQKSGANDGESYVGPFPVALARPMEQSTQIPGIFPWAMQWSSTIDWVFLADNATAAATRRIVLYEYNRTTNAFSWKGFITLTYPTATNHTIRALRMTYDLHTTGTVSVSGTAVTGSSTNWSSDGACVGNRIGFGSTDPTQISTWYEISAIGSNTSITLTGSAGTISAGTAYVIEDLRAVTLTTNATATNGGLYVTKGLRHEAFSSIGTTIPAAVTTDNIRAVYWVADASTVTNTTGAGLAIEPRSSFTSHVIWALDGTTTMKLFKYNLRAALSLASGKATNALLFATGTTGTLTGTASQANNGRYAVTSHGPGSGVGCIYFTTTTRIYRTNATSGITTGSTTFLADNATEIPPGGTNTFGASSLVNSIEYISSIDKFIVPVNTSTTAFRPYITQYRTDGGQWDRIFLVDNRQIDQSTVDSGTTPFPSILGRAFSAWSEGGVTYLAGIGTTALTNHLYALPLSADWEYSTASSNRIILPSMSTPNADKYIRVIVTSMTDAGGNTGQNLGVPTEGFRISYRTSGISDNSGSWTLVSDTGTLSGVTGASAIQFMLEFRTIGLTSIPSRVFSVNVLYENLTTLSNYQPSVGNSNLTSKRFAWRFSTAFGSSVPALRVRLYDAVSGGLLVDDNTASATGTFERSTDGGSNWSSWNNTDKGNDTTYLRYTPASLSDSVRVRALLTLN